MNHDERKRQLIKTKESFNKQPSTMLMVSKDTDILRSNICRYVASLKKTEEIFKVKDGICPISKHPATFYSTNPTYANA